uniref:Signal peptide containing protein n=1 Tax=Caenorhabditis tropicalis TaxID=1561998 RepID=A0A1I7UPN1_9PELO
MIFLLLALLSTVLTEDAFFMTKYRPSSVYRKIVAGFRYSHAANIHYQGGVQCSLGTYYCFIGVYANEMILFPEVVYAENLTNNGEIIKPDEQWFRSEKDWPRPVHNWIYGKPTNFLMKKTIVSSPYLNDKEVETFHLKRQVELLQQEPMSTEVKYDATLECPLGTTYCLYGFYVDRPFFPSYHAYSVELLNKGRKTDVRSYAYGSREIHEWANGDVTQSFSSFNFTNSPYKTLEDLKKEEEERNAVLKQVLLDRIEKMQARKERGLNKEEKMKKEKEEEMKKQKEEQEKMKEDKEEKESSGEPEGSGKPESSGEPNFLNQ